jgi:hypothetical protein
LALLAMLWEIERPREKSIFFVDGLLYVGFHVVREMTKVLRSVPGLALYLSQHVMESKLIGLRSKQISRSQDLAR